MNCPNCKKEIIDVSSDPLTDNEVEIYLDSWNRLTTIKSLLEVDKIPFDMLDENKVELYLKTIVNEYLTATVYHSKVLRTLLSGKPMETFIRKDELEFNTYYFSKHLEETRHE
jgi:hypothetical protein